MGKFDEHPTVVKMRGRSSESRSPAVLDAEDLRSLCLAAGADDVGFVEIDRAELAEERQEVHRLFPWCKSLVAFVVRMNREPVRSAARSVANHEFHRATEDVTDVGAAIVRALEERGVRAVDPPAGFPMEVDRFPGRIWTVAHKPAAVAAGLGRIGVHRNVIHPRFGNFILLGTILVDAAVSEYSTPIDYNPCLECKLCVAACPVGAIHPDGAFDFSACATHNYREFMSGFTDWVEEVVDSRDRLDYRSRFTDAESVSVWQSLSFGANYKAAYCLAVCPAGEDVIGPYLADKPAHLRETLKPLQAKEETLYVMPNSDAEAYARRRFPHKKLKQVGKFARPRTVDSFLKGLPHFFQRGKAAKLSAVYHFQFTGAESRAATVVIDSGTISARDGFHGKPDLVVTADAKTWFGFLAGERNVVWALLTRRIKLTGPLRLLQAFGACFPG